MYTPIALFAYNRKRHLINTVKALQDCSLSNQSDLFLFIDGPKSDAKSTQKQEVIDVVDYAKTINGFKSIKIIEQQNNLGLANSIINGITQVLQNHKAVIVLEDDMLVGNDFLVFMNEALLKYENENAIAGVSGYSFPIQEKLPYFTRTGSCWGWATYKRVWDNFLNARNTLNLDLIPAHELALFNVYDSVYSTMFLQSKQGLIQSWAIEFYLYYFSQKQYFLMPGLNLIGNTGFDGSGVHQKNGNFLTDKNLVMDQINLTFPNQIEEQKHIRMKIAKLYANGYERPFFMKNFVNKIKSVLLGNENNHH